MEAAGDGFDKIMQDYEHADEKHRPYIFSLSDHFTLVLPDLTYAEGITNEDIPEIETVPVANGTEHDEKILAFCYKNAGKASEIAGKLGISDSSYFRKTILANLETQGYLISLKVVNA